MAIENCLRLLRQAVRRARSLAATKAGRSSDARMAMIATTTSSSISVNAASLRIQFLNINMLLSFPDNEVAQRRDSTVQCPGPVPACHFAGIASFPRSTGLRLPRTPCGNVGKKGPNPDGDHLRLGPRSRSGATALKLH